jgi:hypothetical protein
MTAKGGDKRAAAAVNGKKVGRPRKQPGAVADGKGKLHPDIAGKVLGSIDQLAYWRELLRCDIPVEAIHALALGERAEIERTLEYVTNRYHGKPAEKIEGSFDPDKPFVLTIEHIGRGDSRSAASPAAKAK